MAGTVVLEFQKVGRSYGQENRKIVILEKADFILSRGEMVGLVAPSGTGKSTLLHMAGLLEKPDRGDVFILGRKCAQLNDNQRTDLRCHAIGFVYQFHHLLPEFTAVENVMLACMINGADRKAALLRAETLLDMLQLKHRKHHRPNELSGGEQQRVAIARAVANNPDILLADEPTGNLDEKTAHCVFDILRNLCRETGLATLIATHNFELSASMDRRITLSGKKVVTFS